MANSAALELILELTDHVSKGLGGIQKELEGTSAKTGILQTALGVVGGGLISKGIDAVTGAFGDLKSGLIDGNAEFERYQVQFGVLLGSTDKAKDRLKELADFGAKTPFELPEVVKADKILQGFGLESEAAAKKFGFSGAQIRTIAGDVASGTGADFTEIANDIGKLGSGATGEAISRFQELGIVTREELTKMGLQFSKSGELTSPLPKAMETVLTAMKGKFGGMMDAQSATFEGMVSNLEDWKSQTLRTIGAPIFDVLKGQLGNLLTFLSSDAVHGAIDGFAQTLAGGIGAAMTWLTDTAIPALVSGWNTIAPVISVVSAAFQDAASALGTGGVGAAISTFGADIGAISPTIGGFISALAPVGDVIQNVIDGFSGVGPYADAISAAFQFISDHATELEGALVAIGAALAGAAIVGGIAGIVAAVASLATPVGAVIAVVALLGAAWAGNWGDIQGKTAAAWAVIQPVLAQLIAWLSQNIPVAIQAASQFWTSTLQPAIAAFGGFLSGTLFPILGQVIAWLRDNIPSAIATASAYWTGTLRPALAVVGGFITGTLIPVFMQIASFLIGALSAATTSAAGIWTGVLQPAFSAVGGVISGVILPILSALANVGLALVHKGAELLGALWQNVLLPALQRVGSYISETLHPVFQAIGNFINTTVKPALDSLGGTINTATAPALSKLGGIAQDVKTWIGNIGGAAQGVIKWLNDLAGKINSIQIPSWLQGHSPPPLANWLTAIGDAAVQTAENIGTMADVLYAEQPGITAAAIDITAGTIQAMANEAGTTVDAVGKPMIQGTIDGLIAMTPDLESALDQVKDKSKDKFKQLVADVKSLVSEGFQSIVDETNSLFGAVGDAAGVFDMSDYADKVAAAQATVNQDRAKLSKATRDMADAQDRLNAANQAATHDAQELQRLQVQQIKDTQALTAANNTLTNAKNAQTQTETDIRNLQRQKDEIKHKVFRGELTDDQAKSQNAAIDDQLLSKQNALEDQKMAVGKAQEKQNAAQKTYDATAKSIKDTQADYDKQMQLHVDLREKIATLSKQQLDDQNALNAAIEKQNTLLYQQDALRRVQEGEMTQIQQAQADAAKIADPKEAAQYLALQLDHIKKYAALQEQIIKAGDDPRQVAFLKQQEDLLRQNFEAQMTQFQYMQESTQSGAEKIAAGAGLSAGDLVKVHGQVDQLTLDTLTRLNDTIGGLNQTLANIGHNAAGTTSWRGGLTWVGERGPELLSLPRGTAIRPNQDSMDAAGSVVIHIDARGASDPRAIEDAGYRGAKRALQEAGATAQIRKRAS